MWYELKSKIMKITLSGCFSWVWASEGFRNAGNSIDSSGANDDLWCIVSSRHDIDVAPSVIIEPKWKCVLLQLLIFYLVLTYSAYFVLCVLFVSCMAAACFDFLQNQRCYFFAATIFLFVVVFFVVVVVVVVVLAVYCACWLSSFVSAMVRVRVFHYQSLPRSIEAQRMCFIAFVGPKTYGIHVLWYDLCDARAYLCA